MDFVHLDVLIILYMVSDTYKLCESSFVTPSLDMALFLNPSKIEFAGLLLFMVRRLFFFFLVYTVWVGIPTFVGTGFAG